MSENFWTSVVGAFSGAFFAFLLEAWRRRREDDERLFEVIQGTQAVLISFRNSLGAARLQSGDIKKAFSSMCQVYLPFTERSLDFGPLHFIASSKRPGLLIDLEIAESSFRAVQRAGEERNRLIEKFMDDPRTEYESFDTKSGAVTARGNPALMKTIIDLNAYMPEAFAHAEEKVIAVNDLFYRFAKEMFPKRKFVRVVATALPAAKDALVRPEATPPPRSTAKE